MLADPCPCRCWCFRVEAELSQALQAIRKSENAQREHTAALERKEAQAVSLAEIVDSQKSQLQSAQERITEMNEELQKRDEELQAAHQQTVDQVCRASSCVVQGALQPRLQLSYALLPLPRTQNTELQELRAQLEREQGWRRQQVTKQRQQLALSSLIHKISGSLVGPTSTHHPMVAPRASSNAHSVGAEASFASAEGSAADVGAGAPSRQNGSVLSAQDIEVLTTSFGAASLLSGVDA